MTKVRAPLTFDNALARIAGLIGWAEMARVVGQAEKTVRNWGDPDTGQQPTINAAVKLDVAFQAAGGGGAPMHETYSLLLEQSRADVFADQIELGRRTCDVIREVSQAEEALVRASMPGATDTDRVCALREVEEGIASLTSTLPLLQGESP
ncbi:hypothetical protein [Sphingomonas sp. PAMC 26605]|uniref:hypothetical protein n=1 Tax=Sphingomonas sp. PAMC 26605 TaxID=1112214 RepID=UPI00026CAC3A|nr:hypothetical protein [Sphingomonas sp. PAMC 26605]